MLTVDMLPVMSKYGTHRDKASRREAARQTRQDPRTGSYLEPAESECEVSELSVMISATTRIVTHLRHRAGRLVYFAIMHDVFENDEWCPVTRIDCKHSSVHQHRFDQRGAEATAPVHLRRYTPNETSTTIGIARTARSLTTLTSTRRYDDMADGTGNSDRVRRSQVLRRLMRHMAVDDGARDLPVTLADGTKPIVVALEHERLSEVMHRVHDSGKSANVFVAMDDGLIVRAEVHLSEKGMTPVSSAENLGPEPIHSDIEIGMFVAVGLQYDNGVECAVRLPNQAASVRSMESVNA
jgi:hypothetical protein